MCILLSAPLVSAHYSTSVTKKTWSGDMVYMGPKSNPRAEAQHLWWYWDNWILYSQGEWNQTASQSEVHFINSTCISNKIAGRQCSWRGERNKTDCFWFLHEERFLSGSFVRVSVISPGRSQAWWRQIFFKDKCNIPLKCWDSQRCTYPMLSRIGIW